MKVSTLMVLLFVALLAAPAFGRLLTQDPVEDKPAESQDNAPEVKPEVDAEKKEEVVEPQPAQGPVVEAKPEGQEAQPVAAEAKVETPAQQPAPQPAPEKKRSNVGLFILIGVSVLGVIAIGTTFILGKQKH